MKLKNSAGILFNLIYFVISVLIMNVISATLYFFPFCLIALVVRFQLNVGYWVLPLLNQCV